MVAACPWLPARAEGRAAHAAARDRGGRRGSGCARRSRDGRHSMSGYRLPSGGRIARDRIIRFTFDGGAFQGFDGDTLASALLAEGVSRFGRSFKYHRPRGVVAAGPEEPCALVELGS